MLHGNEAFETDEGDPDDEFEAWVRASGRQEIKAIMFADVVGYSKLPETIIPKYVAYSNQRVSRLMADSSSAPVNVNIWGDGLFFVFNGVEMPAASPSTCVTWLPRPIGRISASHGSSVSESGFMPGPFM